MPDLLIGSLWLRQAARIWSCSVYASFIPTHGRVLRLRAARSSYIGLSQTSYKRLHTLLASASGALRKFESPLEIEEDFARRLRSRMDAPGKSSSIRRKILELLCMICCKCWNGTTVTQDISRLLSSCQRANWQMQSGALLSTKGFTVYV